MLPIKRSQLLLNTRIHVLCQDLSDESISNICGCIGNLDFTIERTIGIARDFGIDQSSTYWLVRATFHVRRQCDFELELETHFVYITTLVSNHRSRSVTFEILEFGNLQRTTLTAVFRDTNIFRIQQYLQTILCPRRAITLFVRTCVGVRV